MQPTGETLLCRYDYDPLDRLAASTSAIQPNTQRFYKKDRLATEIQGAAHYSIMQHNDQLLAQHQSGALQTRLLATDQQRSVLDVLHASRPDPLAYMPYGHCPPEYGVLSLVGFNGERPDPITGHYLLGNGYRAYNPILMRFCSPDSLSPFDKGGLNAYAYCAGDPVNRSDPTGHFFRRILRKLGLFKKKTPVHTPAAPAAPASPVSRTAGAVTPSVPSSPEMRGPSIVRRKSVPEQPYKLSDYPFDEPTATRLRDEADIEIARLRIRQDLIGTQIAETRSFKRELSNKGMSERELSLYGELDALRETSVRHYAEKGELEKILARLRSAT